MENKKQNNKKCVDNFFSKRDLGIASKKEIKCRVYRFGKSFDLEKETILERMCDGDKNKSLSDLEDESSFIPSKDIYSDFIDEPQNIFPKKEKRIGFLGWLTFAPVALLMIVWGINYVQKGIETQGRVMGVSRDAYANMNMAMDGIKERNFATSANKFSEAYKNFSEISTSLEDLGKSAIVVSRFIPGVSKLSSGYYATEAGKNLSLAGEKISKVAGKVDDIKNKKFDEDENFSLLDFYSSFDNDINEINEYLLVAQDNLVKVKINDIPESSRDKILVLKNKLPIIIQSVEEFSANNKLISDLIGANGPRKYLFLFQNNQEMRATGGFIGSYGILDIDGSGRIRNFFIDGIFNPDGQLTDKIIPPKPIQKISTSWSLHDSNWFPDFPVSAKKAILFYEKTGGPTVDGVITITPTVMQKLIGITGPIEMSEYGVVLTQENFIENIQYEVEEDYDKEENRPKKILSDLAPILMDKLINSNDVKSLAETLNVLSDALAEKHILLYFSNEELQKLISVLGWSGEILATSNDYLSVIDTNINGYKTDGVVNEKIEQQVDISFEGEIVNTVSITRKHNGGGTRFEWWNKVNADYMRVYVPQGSTLLEVDGQTREINSDVVDYKSLAFEEDEDVKKEELQMQIDDKTGTRIYNESGKTVFANWVYVSPQEEVTVRYKYLLPFKIDRDKDANSYSLLAQKQSGSLGSEFSFSLNYPNSWREKWRNDRLQECSSIESGYARVCFEDKLKTDKFLGIVFGKE